MADAYPLKEADLLPLSLGAALLGTGGGGNPYVGMLRARELLRGGAEVSVLPLEALADGTFVGEVGGIGARDGADVPVAEAVEDVRVRQDDR